MKEDPEQRNNLNNQHPDKIEDLASLLKTYRDQGYSVEREKN